MTALWITAVSSLLATVYCSALLLSLLGFSRAGLERRLDEADRAGDGVWLNARLDSAILALSLVRTIVRLAFFASLLLAIVDVEGRLTWIDLLVPGAIAAMCIWISTVIATALARYASIGIIASGMPVLKAITVICLPLTRGLAFVDEAIKRLTGANLADAEEAEAKLLQSIEETQREGGLDEEAVELLENVVEFRNTTVSEVMTPRTDIEGVELSDDLAAIRSFIAEAGHSRIPVYRESLDQIAGILYVKDLVPYLGQEAPDFQLEPLLRQPFVVPETKPVRELLGDFKSAEIHLAIVIDEYGGTAGLVTIEDVLEEIVGEIHDEHEPDDEEEPSFETIDDTRYEVDGRYHIDDLNEHIGLGLPEDGDFDTVAGFVLSQLGHVPDVGESIESHGARFTAIAATPTHVQRLSIELLEPALIDGARRSNGK